jgi:hypothetical protein
MTSSFCIEKIDVGYCSFQGSLPADFASNWKELTSLEIDGNSLEGPLPTEIGTLSKLSK